MSLGVIRSKNGEAELPKRPENPLRFVCVNDTTPEETTRLLREACERRGVEYVEVQPVHFDFRPERQLVPGDLLYRPAVSLFAQRVEQFLYAPGVATFYRDPEGVHYVCNNQPVRLQRVGVPIARSVYATSASHAVLDSQIELLGGLPVVVKYHGHSGGVGVFLADSKPSLYALVGYAVAQGIVPMILSYAGDAIHWRVIVVGDEAIAAYRNPLDGEDFRTYGGTEAGDFPDVIDPDLADVAVRAAHAVRYDFGGVDVLQHASGRLYVLESNFPCYHPHAELHGGVDVSGKMLDYLIRKAGELSQESVEVTAV